MPKQKITFVVCVIFFMMQGCSQQKEELNTRAVQLDGDGIVLATVNGSPITRYDVDMTIEKTFSKKSSEKLDDEGKKKVLETLAASRAIALKSEASITPRDLAAIEKKVKAYREQMLVQHYISIQAHPEPVTQEMVEDYYRSHPEKFGEETRRAYEMISTEDIPKIPERDAIISEIKTPESVEDWQKWVGEMKQKGLPVFYKKGTVIDNLFHPKISKLINSMGNGETSKLTFVDSRPYVVRITGIKQISPRPLSEVSAQIRKSLAPVQLKKAVKTISEQALKDATVIYENG